jgi:hypothetical protein
MLNYNAHFRLKETTFFTPDPTSSVATQKNRSTAKMNKRNVCRGETALLFQYLQIAPNISPRCC